MYAKSIQNIWVYRDNMYIIISHLNRKQTKRIRNTIQFEVNATRSANRPIYCSERATCVHVRHHRNVGFGSVDLPNAN